jgi:hypothetical protein
MPVGTSDGQYYESDLHALFDIKPEGTPGAPTEPVGASKSTSGTEVAKDNKPTREAPSFPSDPPITDSLKEQEAEGKKYHFRFTPEDFKNKFGKDPIHNDFDEIFRFKNGDYGVHIAPPAPKPDPGIPVGSNPSSSDIASMTHGQEQPNPAAPYIDKAKRVAEGLASPITAAKNLTQSALRGEDLMNPESIRQSWEATTGLASTGTAGATAGLGIFGGRVTQSAKTLADAMESKGMSEHSIKYFTGLERGIDDQWLHEIVDKGSTVNVEKLKSGLKYHLKDILDHPEFYEKYPEAKTIPVSLAKFKDDRLGEYDPNTKEIRIGKIPLQNRERSREVILHELQHWVQHKDNPKADFKIKMDPNHIEAFGEYLADKYYPNFKDKLKRLHWLIMRCKE